MYLYNTHVYTHTDMHTYVCICTNTHTYTQTHTHACIHIDRREGIFCSCTREFLPPFCTTLTTTLVKDDVF